MRRIFILLCFCIVQNSQAVVFEYLDFSRADSSEVATYYFTFYGDGTTYSGSFGLGPGDTSQQAMLYATGSPLSSMEGSYIDLYLEQEFVQKIFLNGVVTDMGGGMYHVHTTFYHNNVTVPVVESPDQSESTTHTTFSGLVNELTLADVIISRDDYSVSRNYRLQYRHANGKSYSANLKLNKGDHQGRIVITSAIFGEDLPDLPLIHLSTVRLFVDGAQKFITNQNGPHVFEYKDRDTFDDGVIPDPIINPHDPGDIVFPEDPLDPFPGGPGEDPYIPPVYDPELPDEGDPYIPPEQIEFPVWPEIISLTNSYGYTWPERIYDNLDTMEYRTAADLLFETLLTTQTINDRVQRLAQDVADDGTGETNGVSGGNVYLKSMDRDVYQNLYDISEVSIEEALQNQELSAGKIAAEINDVLRENGLKSDDINIAVRSALNDQGLSGYEISVSVQDALHNMELTGENFIDWGTEALQNQKLNPWQIATEIGKVLRANGLDSEGIESAVSAVFKDHDISAGNFQIAFEAALLNKGLSAGNIEAASAQALAGRQLSAGQIGREVGNQVNALGLSTRANDDANTDRIVGAIEGLSFESDNSPIVDAVGGLADSFTNYISGSLSSSGVGYVDTDPEDFDTYDTNTIPGEVGGFISSAEGKINVFREFVNEVFVFDPPAIDRAASATIDFASFGSLGDFELPVYNLDLSISPIVKFRTFELFCLYVLAFFAAAKIVHNTIAGC